MKLYWKNTLTYSQLQPVLQTPPKQHILYLTGMQKKKSVNFKHWWLSARVCIITIQIKLLLHSFWLNELKITVRSSLTHFHLKFRQILLSFLFPFDLYKILEISPILFPKTWQPWNYINTVAITKHWGNYKI